MRIKNKNKIIQNSARLQNKMNTKLFDKQSLNYGRNDNNKNNNFSYRFSNFYIDKNELIKKRNKLDNSDINLISDNNFEDFKLINEAEYEKFRLKNKNNKSSSSLIGIGNKLKKLDLNNRNKSINKAELIPSYTDNYEALNSPRKIWFYLKNRIMPPNEL